MRTCTQCTGEVLEYRGESQFCSAVCEGRYAYSRREDKNVASSLSRSDIGAVSEMLVSADLLRRGYHVFRAISPNGPVDLIAMKDGKPWRIEVKTGTIYRGTERRSWPKPRYPEQTDHVAVVFLAKNEITYIPELPAAIEAASAA